MDFLINIFNINVPLGLVLIVTLLILVIYYFFKSLKNIGFGKLLKIFAGVMIVIVDILGIVLSFTGIYMFYINKMLRFLIPVVIGLILIFLILCILIVIYFSKIEDYK